MSTGASAGEPRAPVYREPGGNAASRRSDKPPAPTPDTLDVRYLPSFGFGARSLMWWATAGLMLIEGSAFAIAVAAIVGAWSLLFFHWS